MAYPSMRSERCSKIYIPSAMSLILKLKIKDIFFLLIFVQDLTSITHLSKICLFQSTTESDTHSRLTGVSEGQENLEKNQMVEVENFF